MNSSHQQIATLIADKREGFGFIQKEFAEFLGLNAPFKNANKNSLFNFIDLFAGIGGMRLPFQEFGGKCIFTSEWDKFAKKTYATNFGELPAGDITKIKNEDIPQHDLLLAGFPCQAFSQAGLKQGFQDTRGTMFFEIQRILASKKPKAFLLENVKQLKGHDKGRTFQIILDILRGEHTQATAENINLSLEHKKNLKRKLDYWVDFKILRARDYGVPQNRERIYIVGFDKKAFPDFNFETMFDWSPTKHSQTRLGNILEANCNVDSKYTISDCLWNGHKKRKLNHQKKGNGFGYSLFNEDSPYANTISARYYKDGSEILIDQSNINKNPRKLTPRECARLQGFPEKFIVDAVSDVQAYKQFGNSVAMPVVSRIAESMVEVFKRYNQIETQK